MEEDESELNIQKGTEEVIRGTDKVELRPRFTGTVRVHVSHHASLRLIR